MAVKALVWGDKDNQLLQTANLAFSKKASLDRFWQEVALNHYPERADFTTKRDLGDDPTSQLYSNEPVLFRREFGNWLGATLRPQGRDWFSITPSLAELQDNIAIQKFLKPKAANLRSVLYKRKSGYTRAQAAADHDYVTFGNNVGSVEETMNKQGLRFRTWHLRDCAWRQNLDGEVDTLFRKLKPTIRDMCAQADKGAWSVSSKVTDRLAKEPDKEVACMHIELPLINYDYAIKRPKFEWASIYYDTENKQLMSYRQVPEFDYYVDRWFLIDGSPYGMSPAVICSMPDARSLQIMTWSVIEAGEKAVEPPLVAAHEAVLGGVNIAAGQITWIDKNYDEKTGEAIRALELGGSPQFGEVLRQGITKNLNAAWYLNKLFMPQDYDKTAYEANRLHEEFLRTAMPLIEPAEAERNGNHLEISLTKAIRLNLLGPFGPGDVPEALKGRETDFDYDNPMQDARKQEATFAYKASMEVVEVTQQFAPEQISQFDFTTAFRDAISGVAPPTWLLDEDKGKAAVAQAQKVAQANRAAAQMQDMAGAAGKAAPALKHPALAPPPPETVPNAGNILQ